MIQRASAATEGSENLSLGFTDGTKLTVAGWFSVTADHGVTVPVRPDMVAYVPP